MNFSFLYKNTLSRQLLVSLFIQAIYTVITPVSMIVLARFLGPEQFGDYAFSVSLVIILSIFSNLGLPVVITRFGAMYHLTQKWNLLKGILTFSNTRIFVSSLAVVALTATLIGFDIIKTPAKYHILAALPIVVFLALSNVRTAILTAIEKVNLSQLPEMILRPVLFLLAILIFYYLGLLNSLTAVTLYTLINLFIYFVGVYLVKKYIRNHTEGISPGDESKLWIHSALPLFFLGGIQVLGAQADVFLLGVLARNEEVGIFKSMYQISLLIIFSLTAVNAIASPHIVRHFEQGNWRSLKKLLIIFCVINLSFALLISLPFFMYGDFFIKILYGEAYLAGFATLRILLVGRFMNAIFGVSNQFLKMMGYERQATKGILIGSVIGVLLSFLLIPKFGMIGAAVASSSALVLWNVYLFSIVVRRIWKPG